MTDKSFEELIKQQQRLVEKALADLQRSNNNYRSFLYYPPEGTIYVRILPPVHGNESFFQVVRYHRIPANNRVGYITRICRRSFGEKCPACELYGKLRNGNEVEQQVASVMRPYTRFLFNAVLLGYKESYTDTTLKTPPRTTFSLEYLATHPVILVLPQTVGEQILLTFNQNPRIIDVSETGFNLSITRMTRKNRTEYSVMPIIPSAPLKNADEALKNAHDLEAFVREQMKNYDDLLNDVISALTEKGYNTEIIQEFIGEDIQPQIPDPQEVLSNMGMQEQQEDIVPSPSPAPISGTSPEDLKRQIEQLIQRKGGNGDDIE